ncbi:hypothetical protein BDW42DRAFT_194084 [Aspergillus taichungensis]|uniref:Uncharacterized protein n=1 Tax=Aspergillus taichungensis TaxID=482145 RepID=A0A2J5HU53_9EURO|nr:hypothetical protein BDW42DRAFT_194084 [Aspergillus taichungensis]
MKTPIDAMPSSTNQIGFRQALEEARDRDDENIPPHIKKVLETAIDELWTRVQSQPDSYVLDRDEFALFNYHRERFRGSPIAQRAVARFWDNYRRDSPSHKT